MGLDYAAQLARTRSSLMESGTTIWADADLMGAIRLSLEEINMTLSTAYTLKDLDSAAATTLPASMEGLLTVGSGVYATAARAVDRAENFELANESASLNGWYQLQRSAFDARLRLALAAAATAAEVARVAGLRTTANAPSASWADDFGEKHADDI